jgi:hypothetical protein
MATAEAFPINIPTEKGQRVYRSPSLDEAFAGVDVVINTANGYGQGNPEIDTQGACNLTDALKVAKVGRYV